MIFLISAITAFFAGFLKTGFGIGGGFFLTPLLTLVMPPIEAVGLITPMMLITDLFTVRLFWRQMDISQILLLVPGCLLGTVLGGYYLFKASSSSVETGIGVIAIVFAGVFMYSRANPSLYNKWNPKPYHGILISVLAGFTSSVAHSGGIILIIYFLAKGFEKEGLIANMVGILLLSDLVKFPIFLINGFLDEQMIFLAIILMPLLFMGSWLGHRLVERLNSRNYGLMLAVIVLICGLILLTDPQELLF